jgi:beta-lactam-binding protein with PASTA domain
MPYRNFKKYLPYIYVLLGITVGLYLLLWLMDSVVMPMIVHNQETVRVPNVIGKPLDEAQSLLGNEKLTAIKSGEQYSEKIPPNTVINQIPKQYSEVKVGRSIYLIISKGRETTDVPNLTGKSLRESRIILIQKGLSLGNVVYAASDSVGFDTVMTQKVSSGTQVPAGSSIDVIVSKGSGNFIKVPNLVGMSLSDAQSTLNESGFILGNVFYGNSGTYLANTVIDQSPAGGDNAKHGSAVNVTLSK